MLFYDDVGTTSGTLPYITATLQWGGLKITILEGICIEKKCFGVVSEAMANKLSINSPSKIAAMWTIENSTIGCIWLSQELMDKWKV